jgi:hypothetical protein
MPINPNTHEGRMLATIYHRRGDGFLKDCDLPELAKLDRLFPCLVRCGGCRFTCAAQDVYHLTGIITKEGSDHVRDISMLCDPPPPKPGPYGSWEKPRKLKLARPSPLYQAFHGNPEPLMHRQSPFMAANGPTGHGEICHSDADPGL